MVELLFPVVIFLLISTRGIRVETLTQCSLFSQATGPELGTSIKLYIGLVIGSVLIIGVRLG